MVHRFSTWQRCCKMWNDACQRVMILLCSDQLAPNKPLFLHLPGCDCDSDMKWVVLPCYFGDGHKPLAYLSHPLVSTSRRLLICLPPTNREAAIFLPLAVGACSGLNTLTLKEQHWWDLTFVTAFWSVQGSFRHSRCLLSVHHTSVSGPLHHSTLSPLSSEPLSLQLVSAPLALCPPFTIT